MTPWLLTLALYILGGFVVLEDMREADRQEPWINAHFRSVSYIVCVGLWPLVVIVVLADFILRKFTKR